MQQHEEVQFTRDCQAIQIPQGGAVIIHAGTIGVLTQALGGTYTVQVPSLGGLFRLAGDDADAIGMERRGVENGVPTGADAVSEEVLWQALKNVYDPEIPVNIVDLGLVYDMRIERDEAGARVHVKMTLTAPGCGMGPAIAMDAKGRIETLPGVKEADVQLVWDPPWNPHMISPEGRARLGMDEA
jgi:probable FeS assembly SUF system protein SufT